MKQENILIFKDTLKFIRNNQILSDGIKNSIKNTEILEENEYPVIKNHKENSKISVSKHRSFEAAINIHKNNPNLKIGVLNFASATNPGGGVINDSSAQEESLCRCSTLFPVLNTSFLFENFYLQNRMKNNPIHDDTVIYSPDIIICKSDTNNPTRLREEEFIKVDVLTCAAPNLRDNSRNLYNLEYATTKVDISHEELYDIHLKRAKHILLIAVSKNIDALVLGAFGCGAFKNNPYIVARAYKDALSDFKDYFKIVEFAIYCSKYDENNYVAFKEVLAN